MKSLLGELDPQVQAVCEDLRQSIAEKLGKKPKLDWMGITWHWCETTIPNDGGTLVAIHFIADPSNPRVAMTLSRMFFETFPPSKLPKLLHNGLATATCIGHLTWCEWSISSQESGEAIMQVIELARG